MITNFKLYIQTDLKKRLTFIDEYVHTEFDQRSYISRVYRHLANKASQSFLFVITPELVNAVNTFMSQQRESHYQFIVIGKNYDNSEDFPVENILTIKHKTLKEYELKWNITKFNRYITAQKQSMGFSTAIEQDLFDDQQELISIGQMLAEERDRDKLIQKILKTSLKITGADAGCVFLVVDNPDGTKGLLFKYSYTFSRQIDFNEYVMPLNEKSISGFCAYNDEVINIPDAYNLDENATYSFNKSIDEKYGYMSRSMLVIPMKNHLGEMIGVIQLINSKECFSDENCENPEEAHKIYLATKSDFKNKVYPFAVRYEDLMLSVAGQASVALDNIKMIHQLEDQFDGMVRASVDAIDSKDPATSGHSHRVSRMSVKFLECINKLTSGPYSDRSFTKDEIKQIEYAALLHDYGKVYIDNEIFLKAKKLYPKDFSILMLRLDLIIESVKNNPDSKCKNVDDIIKIRELVRQLNEPRMFHENPKEIIDGILTHKDDFIVYDGDNNLLPLLTTDEIINLQISRGTLNRDERKEIESHVTYTSDFLKSIPWPKELARIPEIAGGHHEMLNGTGYPKGLTAEDLNIEQRILAILDIFDALSASDRPYKDAVPFNKVESILLEEGINGRLDNDLIKIFLDHKLYDGLY